MNNLAKLCMYALVLMGIISWKSDQRALAQDVGICIIGVPSPCNDALASNTVDSWLITTGRMLGTTNVSVATTPYKTVAEVAASQSITSDAMMQAIYQTEKLDIVIALRAGTTNITEARKQISVARTAAQIFITQPFGKYLTKIDVQKANWQAYRYRDYQFDVTLNCFCTNMPPYVTVTVRNDVVVDVIAPEGWSEDGSIMIDSEGMVITAPLPIAVKRKFQKTLMDYFVMAEDSEAQNVYRLVTEYDKVYGFLTRLSIDYSKDVMDEELDYRIKNFLVLQ